MSTTPRVAIGDLATFRGGGTPSKSRPDFYIGDIPWVSPKDMKSWEIISAQDKITTEAINESATSLLPVDSILIVNRSGILKHTLPVALSKRPVAINQDLKALICGERVKPTYLARMIKAAEPIVLGWVRATTADNFPIDNLKLLEIPLPPLPEQRRIAAILDAADALRQKRRQALQLLDQLAQSMFIDLFGDPVSNPMGWDDTRVLSDFADIASGITKGRRLNGDVTREVPYLAVYNVQDKALRLDQVKTIEATEDEIARYRLMEKDLLLTEGGDPDKLGRGTLWHNELPGCIHQNHIFRVRLSSPDVDPLYLNWLVGSQRGKQYFLRSAKQTTGIASINMTQLRAFPMLLPPMELQREFARRLSALKTTSEQANAHAGVLEKMFASLQQRAFNGEL